jgi:hypothetical protein
MTRRQSEARGSKAADPKAKTDEKDETPVSRLKALGGGDCDQWNSRITRQLFAAMPGLNCENAQEASRATLSGLLEINSTDPIEGMLSAQIIAAHEASMHLRQLAWLPEQSFEAVTKFLELAEKAARTVGILTDRLDQHRGRGQQQITVKHVTVNADQALVADSITTGKTSRSNPARPPSNLLTTGGQKPMEILDGDLVGVGGEKEI